MLVSIGHRGLTLAACTTSDTTACETSSGTTITFQDVTAQQGPGNSGFLFKCTGSLISWVDTSTPARAGVTKTGSGWPLHLNINFTAGNYNYATGQPVSEGTVTDVDGVSLNDNCTGDGDPSTIDLIVHVQGDGRTYGVQTDAFKLNGSTGPHDIQITSGNGSINCGPREGANAQTAVHQDGVQVQNGNNIGFYGFTIGDWANKRATCWGAGGAFFLSSVSTNQGNNLTLNNVRGIACNHALNGDGADGLSTGSVTNSIFRTGRPSDQTDVLATDDVDTPGTKTVGLCQTASPPVSSNTLSMANWTFSNALSDPWAQTGQSWSPGFNPSDDSSVFYKFGDLNNDLHINLTDLSMLLSNYAKTSTVGDLNGDGVVTLIDLSKLLSHYGV